MEIVRIADKGDHYRVVARVQRRYSSSAALFNAIAAALPEAERFYEVIASEYAPGRTNPKALYVCAILA